MRPSFRRASIVLLVAVPVFAQVHAGGTSAHPAGNGFTAGRSGMTRGGTHPAPPPPVAHPSHGRTVVVPYPVFYGLPYYSSYAVPPAGGAYQDDQGAYAQPYADQSYPGQNYGDESPVVIINQQFRPDTVNPQTRDYSNTPLPPPTVQRYDATTTPQVDANGLRDDEPTIFLIALKDHSIFPAIAYWVSGDTLKYVTEDATQKSIPLDMVDREFSKQLNDERRVQFKLPPPK